jgi:ABC-type glycerol-3-phosphate transport system substrate-binding protein
MPIDAPDISSLPEITSNSNKTPIETTIHHKSIQNLDNSTWLEYISDNFNIKIIPVEQFGDDGIAELIKLQDNIMLTGLYRMYMNELEQIYDTIQMYALPLNEILEANQVWVELPLDLKEAMKINGTIWTFPTHYKPYGDQMYLRLYNSEILNELNLDVPSTHHEFEKVMRKVQESGFMDYTIPIMTDNPFHQLIDLFWSFNIPISASDYYISSIQYDYDEGIYRDYTETRNMQELLVFIKHLVSSGIIKTPPEHMDSEMLFKLEQAFSIQSMIYDRTDIKDIDYDYSFIMNKADVDIKIPVSKIGGVYILLKDTKNPQQIMNRLMDAMLSSEEANISAYLGYDQSKYQVKPDSVIYDGRLYGTTPALFRNIVSEKAFLSGYTTKEERLVRVSDNELKAYEDSYTEYINFIDPARIIAINPYIDSKRTGNKKISMLFNDIFKEILNENVAMEDLYDEYKSAMQKIGGQTYIEELNIVLNP